MKILIATISDIHLKEGSNDVFNRVKAMRELISAQRKADLILLVYPGDVGFSGAEPQYTLAEDFCDAIYESASKSIDGPVYEIFAPGNHDLNLESAKRSRQSAINELTRNFGSLEPSEAIALLEECTEAQEEFWTFVQSRAKQTPPVSASAGRLAQLYNIPSTGIYVSVLNSAAMSTLNEQQGSLFIHPKVIPMRPEECSFLMTIVHHPLNWLEAWNARIIGSEIGQFSELILTGHEHLAGQSYRQEISRPGAIYIHASVMQESAKSAGSGGPTLLTADLKSRRVEIYNCSWRGMNYGRHAEPAVHEFDSADRRVSTLQATVQFEAEFLRDPGIAFSHPSGRRMSFDDLYVEPVVVERSLEDVSSEQVELVTDSAAIVSQLTDSPYVLIESSERAGKTSFLKKLWRQLHERNFKPLYLKMDKDTVVNDDVLNQLVARQYGSGAVELYWSTSRADRVCLVDDLDVLEARSDSLHEHLQFLQEQFASVVCTTSDLFVVEEIVRRSETSSILASFKQCRLLPLGHGQRGEMVERWVHFHSDLEDDQKQVLINKAEAVLNNLLDNDLLPSLPLFVLSVLQSIDAARDHPGAMGAYAYHYETLIRDAIFRSLSGRRFRATPISREIVEVQSAYLAYSVFSSGKALLGIEELEALISQFRQTEKHVFSISEMIDVLLDAEILSLYDGGIRFKYQHTYQYFVAKRLSIGFNRVEERSGFRRELTEMLDNLQSAEYSNIVMLVLYLNPDGELIQELSARASRLYSGFKPCNLTTDVEFASRTQAINFAAAPGTSQVQNRRARREAQDRSWAGRRELQNRQSNAADPKFEEAMADLNRALKTLEAMGQVLRNFPATLSVRAKEDLVNEALLLGLRTMEFFVELVRKEQTDVEAHLQKITEGECDPNDLAMLSGRVSQMVANLIMIGSYGLVKRIGRALGSEHLSAVIVSLQTPDVDAALKLVTLEIQLDQAGKFPVDDLKSFSRDMLKARHLVAWQLARQLVWDHLLLYPVEPSSRQAIASTYNFRQQDPRILALPNAQLQARFKRARPHSALKRNKISKKSRKANRGKG